MWGKPRSSWESQGKSYKEDTLGNKKEQNAQKVKKREKMSRKSQECQRGRGDEERKSRENE